MLIWPAKKLINARHNERINCVDISCSGQVYPYADLFVSLSIVSLLWMYRNYTLANECTHFCSDIEKECLLDCGGDEFCEFGCSFDAFDCQNYWPCYPGCPYGCDSCPSSFCNCRDYETSPEYLTCLSHYEEMYTACILDCDTADVLCVAACARDFDSNVLECPCNKNCLHGCPCDNYDCPLTTTQSTTTTHLTLTTVAPGLAVLILNTFNGNVPVITDASGQFHSLSRFTFDENTSVWRSCSITFRNHFYIYGGDGDQERQISRVDGCRLRIGELPFDHKYLQRPFHTVRIWRDFLQFVHTFSSSSSLVLWVCRCSVSTVLYLLRWSGDWRKIHHCKVWLTNKSMVKNGQVGSWSTEPQCNFRRKLLFNCSRLQRTIQNRKMFRFKLHDDLSGTTTRVV